MFAFGTSNWFEENPDGVRLVAAVSTSPIVKEIGPVEASSFTERSVISLMVGRSFTGLTVRRKVLLVLATPSLTEMEMTAEPDWLVAGERATVRLAPVPTMTMLALGTSVGLKEAAE